MPWSPPLPVAVLPEIVAQTVSFALLVFPESTRMPLFTPAVGAPAVLPVSFKFKVPVALRDTARIPGPLLWLTLLLVIFHVQLGVSELLLTTPFPPLIALDEKVLFETITLLSCTTVAVEEPLTPLSTVWPAENFTDGLLDTLKLP